MMKERTKTRLPVLLHILAGLCVLILLMNISGIVQTIQSWNWLLAAGYFPHPVYSILKGVMAGLGSLVAALALWLRAPWAPQFGRVLAILLLGWFWADRILLTRNPLPFKDHIFALVVSALLLFFILVSLWLLQPWMSSSASTNAPVVDEGGLDE